MKYIFYHSADHDGQCSGAIAKRYCEQNKVEYVLCPIDYGKPIPDVTGKEIIVCDFSFENKMQDAIKNAADFIWIDHHISAIKEHGNSGLKGLRDTQFAACELTWKYFFPKVPMPLGVELLGKYDSWRHEENPTILGFEWYLRGYDTSLDKFDWNQVLDMSEDEVAKCAGMGLLVLNKDKISWKFQLKTAFEKTILGSRCILINTQEKGSMIFDDKLKDYDFGIVFYMTPSLEYKHSVYSVSKDSSEFAKHFNGGGHKGAAGFITNELVWKVGV